MSKYSEQFKLAVVEEYLSGFGSCARTGRKHGVSPRLVREWVAAFRHHGQAALKAKPTRVTYDADFKLKVLQHMWANGLTHTEAAATFDIRTHGVLSAWERSYHSGGLEALAPKLSHSMKKMTLPGTQKPTEQMESAGDHERPREQLIAELNYLRMENAYLKKLKALVQAEREKTQRGKRKSSKN